MTVSYQVEIMKFLLSICFWFSLTPLLVAPGSTESSPYSQLWTSFLKARLNCSLPGDFPFYFDEIRECGALCVSGVFEVFDMKKLHVQVVRFGVKLLFHYLVYSVHFATLSCVSNFYLWT